MPAPVSFPTDTVEKRRVLMDAVESVRPTLEAGAAESEEIGTLAAASVDALYDSDCSGSSCPTRWAEPRPTP